MSKLLAAIFHLTAWWNFFEISSRKNWVGLFWIVHHILKCSLMLDSYFPRSCETQGGSVLLRGRETEASLDWQMRGTDTHLILLHRGEMWDVKPRVNLVPCLNSYWFPLPMLVASILGHWLCLEGWSCRVGTQHHRGRPVKHWPILEESYIFILYLLLILYNCWLSIHIYSIH